MVQCTTVETKCNNNIPGTCSNDSRPCGCQVQCQAPNVNQPPNCTWNCNQADPVCSGAACNPPTETPECFYNNPSWCTTAKNCNPTKDPFPAWLIVLVVALGLLLLFGGK